MTIDEDLVETVFEIESITVISETILGHSALGLAGCSGASSSAETFGEPGSLIIRHPLRCFFYCYFPVFTVWCRRGEIT